MAGKMKILVVEDQPGVALMMVHLLTMAGWQADAALNGERALRMAQDADFDLITLEVNLPGSNGFELCRTIRQIPRHKHVSVIFVSSRNNEEDRQRAFDLGAVDYIEKPFDPQDFVARILSGMMNQRGAAR